MENNLSKNLFLRLKDVENSVDNTVLRSISFTKEELECVSNCKEANNIVVSLSSYDADDGYVCLLKLDGTLKMLNDKTNKVVDYELHTEDYLNLFLSKENEKESDVEVDKGVFNFDSVVRAIFYQAVPVKFNKNQKYYKTDDYEVISESDYLARQKKKKEEGDNSSNPFDVLKNLNIDE